VLNHATNHTGKVTINSSELNPEYLMQSCFMRNQFGVVEALNAGFSMHEKILWNKTNQPFSCRLYSGKRSLNTHLVASGKMVVKYIICCDVLSILNFSTFKKGFVKRNENQYFLAINQI
jgi:hypothetical protein